MLGATLMFFSVVTMALTRLPAKSHVPESTMEARTLDEWRMVERFSALPVF